MGDEPTPVRPDLRMQMRRAGLGRLTRKVCASFIRASIAACVGRVVFDVDQRPSVHDKDYRLGLPLLVDDASMDEKQPRRENKPSAVPEPTQEARRILQEYVDDLREIIRTLREKLN